MKVTGKFSEKIQEKVTTVQSPVAIETETGWRNAIKAALPPFVLTRLVFLLLTYFEVLFIVRFNSGKVVSLSAMLNNWNQWDVHSYEGIALFGYRKIIDAAFFPLFPLLQRGISIVLHTSVLVAGMLLANLAFFGVLVVLYRFVEKEFDSETAQRSILYLSIFPTAFFFFAGYNESLFLFFVVLCFYMLRRGSWWLAGLCGALAVLTRSAGLLLIPVFFYEFVRQVYPDIRSMWIEGPRRRIIKRCMGLSAILLPCIALGLYAVYLKIHLGDPLAFSHAQAHWSRSFQMPWVAPLQTALYILSGPLGNFFTAHMLIDLTAFLLFAVLIVLTFSGPERFRADQWSLSIYGALLLLLFVFFPTSAGDRLESMQRFVLEVFPAFILLARLGRHRWIHQSYLILALPLLAFFTLQFLGHYWTV